MPGRMFIALSAILSGAALSGSVWGDSDRYRVIVIPAPEGASYANATAMNGSNEVTGSALIGSMVKPFLYSDGECVWLDQIPGVSTSGHGINDGGHVAGWMYTWGVIWPEAFLWDGAAHQPLGTLNGDYSYGEGLNNHDEVVGWWTGGSAAANGHAFVHTGGRMIDLGPGIAFDISETGVVVGSEDRGFSDAALWEPGPNGWTRTVLEGREILSVNSSGTIAAGTGPSGGYFDRASMWTLKDSNWVRTDLGDWDPLLTHSMATGVNDAGQIVGTFEELGEATKAFLFEDGEVSWLTDRLAPDFAANWTVTRALAINESGHILAEAKEGLAERSVILVPDRLSVLSPRPGVAGERNELIATGATPDAVVYFVYGLTTGSTPLPNCPGVIVDIAAPKIAGSARANKTGEARMRAFVPVAAAGATVYLQAVEPASCAVSRRIHSTIR
ncbi:MAG: hypothetical protein ACF8PN_01880 [Phycisphaerales bacterium]